MKQTDPMDLESTVRSVLGDLAKQVMLESMIEIEWHIEVPLSRIYAVSGMLVFAPHSDPTTELVVASMKVRRNPAGEWTLDVTGRESRLLAMTRVHAGEQSYSGHGIAGAAEFFQQLVPVIVAELRER